VASVTLLSPAKINLFLAVTGRRADGFHDLVSVVAPLEFGDELTAEESGSPKAGSGAFTLECDDPAVPVDGTNLVLKAAASYAAATGWKGGVHFRLTKRIPLGAGLGGGSSNAVAALRAVDRLAGGRADAAQLEALAAGLGSDCPLFLQNGPVILRGRGERVEPLPEASARRLRGQSVLLCKPSFAVSTAWAYARMAARGTDYLPAAEAERRLAQWQAQPALVGDLLFNNMEPAAFEKYPALSLLLQKIGALGFAARMSGSGSACFAWSGENQDKATVAATIREAWGSGVFLQKTHIC